MSYKVIFSEAAEEDLSKLTPTDCERILKKIEKNISKNPEVFSKSVKELGKNGRVSRIGKWRSIFNLKKLKKQIEVKIIDNREKIYKRMKRVIKLLG